MIYHVLCLFWLMIPHVSIMAMPFSKQTRYRPAGSHRFSFSDQASSQALQKHFAACPWRGTRPGSALRWTGHLLSMLPHDTVCPITDRRFSARPALHSANFCFSKTTSDMQGPECPHTRRTQAKSNWTIHGTICMIYNNIVSHAANRT